jgi:crossover junction endodeoxyribonuclease RuvC
VILGIDPGLDGGIAILDGSSIELLETIPTEPKGGFIKRQVDAQKLSNILRVYPISVCYLEKVSSRPGQGVGSVFSFGDTYGAIRGVLGALGIPTYYVMPQTWKKWFKISSKEESLKAAEEILKASKELSPWGKFRKKDHNIAEALLIAYYGQKERENVKNDI